MKFVKVSVFKEGIFVESNDYCSNVNGGFSIISTKESKYVFDEIKPDKQIESVLSINGGIGKLEVIETNFFFVFRQQTWMHIDDVESNNKIKLNGGVSVKFNGIGNTFHEEEIKDGRANIELIKNSRFGGFSSRKTVITIEDGNWNHVTT
uniref:Uncharacterized protein n=1 Tax=Meloidogyne enterolobii TaxID=390850 RepID=A0A6V7UEM0_MELEN|nr:unnamed protein product [Meloidogyne enterolobii]